MKLKSNITPAQILDIVQKCQGDVYLSTSAGDEINLEKNLSIQDIAGRVGYTPNYLGRKFKKEIGYTIGDYIHIKKMEYAKVLLRDKRMSIQDVSERLGYCSGSYFSEMFRRYVKLSPTEYLAQFEGKGDL